MAGKTADEWKASMHVRTYMGGQRGGTVRFGDFMVPKHLTVEFEPDPLQPEGRRRPLLVMEYEIRDGNPICTDLRVTSRPGDRPVRITDLGVINIEEIGATAFAQHAWRITSDQGHTIAAKLEALLDPDAVDTMKSKLNSARDMNHIGSITELRDVARVYLDPINRSKPSKAVAETLGYSHRSTASRRIADARQKGLIPPPGASPAELDAALEDLRAGPSVESPEDVAERIDAEVRRRFEAHQKTRGEK